MQPQKASLASDTHTHTHTHTYRLHYTIFEFMELVRHKRVSMRYLEAISDGIQNSNS